MGRMVYLRPISRNRMLGMVIGEDEYDVGPICRGQHGREQYPTKQQYSERLHRFPHGFSVLRLPQSITNSGLEPFVKYHISASTKRL